MLTSVRSLTAASVFALSAAFATPALADDHEDGGIGVEVSANVAMVSEYRFRGVDLSGGEFAIQGGVDVGLGIPDTPVSVTAHLGYTDGFLTFTNDGEALDWSLGAELAVPGTPIAVGVAYVGVEGDALVDPGGVFTDDAVVVSLTGSF